MNKKYIYIMIFSIILIVISCLYILITDVPPKDKYIDNSKNINIRISKNNYVEKKILIENDNQIDNQYEIKINNSNIDKKSVYILYKLIENNKVIKKGILHNNQVLGIVSVKAQKKKEYTIRLESINNIKENIIINGNIETNKYKEKEISYLTSEYGRINHQMIFLANNQKVSKDQNIKKIKLADKIDDKYQKDEYIISDKDSTKPIYMWYENSVIYFYSENEIGLPDYSERIFASLEKLEDIKDLKYFHTERVISMSSMFYNDTNLNNISALSYWDTSNVKYMSYMFSRCTELTDITSLAAWDISNVETLSNMFFYSGVRNIEPLNFWNTSNVTNISSIFSDTEIKKLNGLENWNVEKVKDMSSAFENTRIESLKPLEKWKTSSLEKMNYMFSNTRIENVDGLDNWDVSNVIEMSNTFYLSIKLENIDALKKWNVSKVKKLNSMFSLCTKLNNITSLKNWQTESLEEIEGMFYRNISLESLKGLDNFKIDEVKSLNDLFTGTKIKDTKYLEKWNTSKVETMDNIFAYTKINNTKGIDNWNITNLKSAQNSFEKTKIKPKWNGMFDNDGSFVK